MSPQSPRSTAWIIALTFTCAGPAGDRVPFGRADGLGGGINGILARLLRDIASGAPLPIARAYRDVVATIRADVKARIDDGSFVVVR